MTLILISNDDGIRSPGLAALRDASMEVGDVMVVAPRDQMSAKGKALTFEDPIVVRDHVFPDGGTGHAVTGTPADTVLVAMHLLKGKPDLVVSGINNGENTSLHSLLTSGTCAVAFEAAFNQIPAVAFSIHVSHEHYFSDTHDADWEGAAKITRKLVKLATELDWPPELAFLNINYPAVLHEETPIRMTVPSESKYNNYLIEKKDPRNDTYYWLWGTPAPSFEPNTDTYVVRDENAVSISPIGLGMLSVNGLFLDDIQGRMQDHGLTQ